jgi:hypothetical protein
METASNNDATPPPNSFTLTGSEFAQAALHIISFSLESVGVGEIVLKPWRVILY